MSADTVPLSGVTSVQEGNASASPASAGASPSADEGTAGTRLMAQYAIPSPVRAVRFGSTPNTWTFFLACLPHFFYSLESYALTVMLPYFGPEGSSNASSTAVTQWLIQVELLLVTTLGTFCGRMCEKMGITNYFIAGMWVFSVFTLLCGIPQLNVYGILALRVFGSFGMGMSLPAANPLICYLADKHRLPLLTGVISAATSVATIMGTFLTGLFVAYTDLHYMFFLIGGLSIAYAAFITALLPKARVCKMLRADTSPRIDWLGAALLLVSTTLIVFAFSSFYLYQWWVGLIVLLIGIGCFTFFAVYNMRLSRHPVLDLGMMKTNQFYVGLAVCALFNVAGFGEKFFHSFIYKNVYGLDSVKVGGFMAIPYAVTAVVSPFLSQMQRRFCCRSLFLLWSPFYFVFLLILACTLGKGYWLNIVFNTLTSICYVGLLTTSQSTGLLASPKKYAAQVGAMNCVAINFGHILGLAIPIASENLYIKNAAAGGEVDRLIYQTGVMIALLLCCFFLLLTFVVAFFLGVGKNERGRIGFSERRLYKTRSYEENLYNNDEMQEVAEGKETMADDSARDMTPVEAILARAFF